MLSPTALPDALAAHLPRLTRYLRSFIRDHALADDVAQDAMLSLLTRPPSTGHAWEYTRQRAVFLYLDHARKHAARVRRLETAGYRAWWTLPGTAPDPADDVLDALGARALLAPLNANQRRALWLVASTSWGNKSGAVQMAAQRARLKLRQLAGVGA